MLDGMPGSELDKTELSFPTYADLTQTKAWGFKAPRIHAELDEAERAADLSQGSRYTEGAVLGVGGMGKVTLARDARVGRDVAVKVLHPERELEPDERARFLREAQVQGQLEHPSIVPVYDIDRRADGTTFFTMRRVLGVTLHALLEEMRKGVKPRYTHRELLTAFATVCLTIDYAHSRGVVHRDLKPANIMLGDFGEVYVLDWGLARLIDESGETVDKPQERLSMPGELMGTPMYMAPEQMADPDVTAAADVFSLGMILFEILTLQRARDPNALFAPVDARPSTRAPYRNVAPELETICVTATAFDPAARYPSARALQEAIARYLEGDRELEQRKQLAASHTKAARAALDRAATTVDDPEPERTKAIQQLVRALALEPQNDKHVALLAEILASPPRKVPPEVEDQLHKQTQRIVRTGLVHSAYSMASWFLFFPLVLWIGIRDIGATLLIAVPAALSLVGSIVALRLRDIGRLIQFACVTFMMIASMAVSRIYGPLVLMPTLIATYVIVLQAHPARSMRRFGIVIATLAIALPVLLELGGILPSSYLFDNDRWVILPQMLALPKTGTLVLLTLANIGMVNVPGLFIAKLRSDLSAAQQHQLVQAWHFRRLGADLVGARTTG